MTTFDYSVPFKGQIFHDPEWVAGSVSGGQAYKTLLGWAAHVTEMDARWQALKCAHCGEHPHKKGKGPVYSAREILCPPCWKIIRDRLTCDDLQSGYAGDENEGEPDTTTR